MTILVDWQIRQEALRNNLVVPFDEEMLNPCSIDVRVGHTAKLRIVGGWQDIELAHYGETFPYMLYPGDRVLIASLETYNFSENLAGQFKLKSSRGREWYEHLEAGWIDPGWHGSKLTMEIIAMDVSPLPLYPGLRMGQIIFFKLDEIPEKSYSVTGKYNNDVTVQESKDNIFSIKY
jgi:dCTP deaminase